MLTLVEIISQIYARQRVIAEALGADITRAPKSQRVMNMALLALLAVVLKVLLSKGVLTVPELLAAFNEARDLAYADEPVEPPL